MKVCFLILSMCILNIAAECKYENNIYTCGARLPSGQYCNECVSSAGCIPCICTNFMNTCDCRGTGICTNKNKSM